VVASGNVATSSTLLRVMDAVLPTYRLNVLNAQVGIQTDFVVGRSARSGARDDLWEEAHALHLL
jgi:hypothetical protein